MKTFLKNYGFVIVSALVVITLVITTSPIGNSIKTETSNLINSFGVVSEVKMDNLDYDLWAAGKDDLTIQILGRDHVNYLYDVGEKNLTDDDVVQINGVDCYVLKVEDNKAELITKDIYDVRFDTGEHISEGDIGNYLGGSGYSDITYNYKYSSLREWMNEIFYHNYLNSNSKIIKTAIKYYTYKVTDNYNTGIGNFDKYVVNEIEQYVYALDTAEALKYAKKFGWNTAEQYTNAFWTTIGYVSSAKISNSWTVKNDSTINIGDDVNYSNVGARPVFWISLE